MEHDNFAWVYLLLFFVVPLASMIPGMLRKRKKGKIATQITQEKRKDVQTNQRYSTESYNTDHSAEFSKKMLVLGSLIKGSSTFEKIQKNTTLGSRELDSILQDLEKNQMLSTHQKKGLFRIQIELHPTEKGIQEYRTYFEQ